MKNYNNFNIVDFDKNLINSLPSSGPRYTSYPTADRFNNNFKEIDYINALNLKTNKNLSLYIHIPFCNVICYYCGCNKIITKDNSKSEIYIQYLKKELDLIKNYLPISNKIRQLHFGGGTPTFLTNEQFSKIFDFISDNFTLADDGEYSIEIDPRKVTKESVYHLAKLGLNRMSIGVQDFDPIVQKSVNRVQSEEETKKILSAAKKAGFKSISMDLIYGLPHQTIKSVEKSLKKVIEISPDRLAFYNYAHLPHIFKPQRRINENFLPSSEEKLDILQMAVNLLKNAGYIFIGMDHFAKPNDELSIALKKGNLQRNFQGYSTHAECDLIGIGVSSIGKVGNNYIQNQKDINLYYESLNENKLPIMRGIKLNEDDLLRRSIIQSLMCKFHLSILYYEEKYYIDFNNYFADEIKELKIFENLDLIKFDESSIWITNKGRFLIRNIAMIFDKYLRNKQKSNAIYSKTI